MDIGVNKIHCDVQSIGWASHKGIANNTGARLAMEVAHVSRAWLNHTNSSFVKGTKVGIRILLYVPDAGVQAKFESRLIKYEINTLNIFKHFSDM